MIDVLGYSCSVCQAPVQVEGITDPRITWTCGHDGQVVHANLAGTLFGESAMLHRRLTDAEIPERHREAMIATMMDRAVIGEDGVRRWKLSDWAEYIDAWHAAQSDRA